MPPCGWTRCNRRRIIFDITEVGTFTDPRVNPWRSNQIVAVRREPKISMAELWPQLKDCD